MNAAGITFGDIESAVMRQNLNISGGELKVGDLCRNIRITGEFDSPDDISNIVVSLF